jgi:hypothetical protein
VRVGEPARWATAMGGVILWLSLPFIVLEGGIAKHAWRCRGRAFQGSFDGCFNDYIPVMELFFIPLLLLATAYPFARLAFSLYGPASEPRSIAWKLSTRGGAVAGWPYLQLLACLGCAWAIWRGLTYPPVRELLPFHFYWGPLALWFAAGALVGLLDRRAESRPGAI